MDVGGARRPEGKEQPLGQAPRRLRASLVLLRHQVHRAELQGADGGRGARPSVRAHHHDRAGRLGHDVADRAETIELGHLQVHQHDVGAWACTFRNASIPLRAVADHGELPGAVHHVGQQPPEEGAVVHHEHRGAVRACWTPCATELHLEGAVGHVEADRAAVVAADRLADERDAVRVQRPAERRPRCARPSGWCPAARARRTCWLPRPAAPSSAAGSRRAAAISSSRRGTAVCGNLAGIAVLLAQRRRGQEHVGQAADPGRGIVQHDRDAAAQAHGDQRRPLRPTWRSATLTTISPAAHAARR